MKEWLLKNGWTEFMDFIRHPDLDFHFAVKYKRFVLFGVPFADFAQAIGGLVKDYSEGKNDAKSAI